MRHLLLLFSIFTLALSAQAQQSFAQDGEPDNYVQFRALAETEVIAAGNEIWIALEQQLYPEWHSYWVNPGDSGAPTTVKWDLPEGFSVSELEWPTPHKLPYGPLLNYGYEGTVTALQKLTVPDTLPEGEIRITGTVEALVCKDICIPEYGPVSITFNAEAEVFADNVEYFNAAQENLPQKTNITGTFAQDGENFVLTLNDTNHCTAAAPCSDVELFPYEWGLIDNTAPVSAQNIDNTLIITQKASTERDISEVVQSDFVFAYTNAEGQKQSFTVFGKNPAPSTEAAQDLAAKKATPEGSALSSAPPPPAMALQDGPSATSQTQNATPTITLTHALLFALLGGLILNLMPCVFPVLSLKALSLVKLSKEERGTARKHGLAYTAGVMLSFLAIAGILIFLKSIGAEIGWGFQLQNPLVVSVLAYLLFILGLNLSGVFEFANPFANSGQKLTQNNNASGSFFTGILATLVATPCTAPFMAAALGYALVQPAGISLAIFAALGFGLALPFLALSFIPALANIMPKPGAWMENFRQFLAFPMFASAAWLIWVMSKQTDSVSMFGVLIGMVSLAFGLWLWARTPKKGAWRAILKIIALVALAAPVVLLPSSDAAPQAQSEAADSFEEVFSQETLDTYLSTTNDPIFVEMTAAWCITCKLNNATSINIGTTKKVFSENNVRYLVGDWTNQDAAITAYLQEFGRNGVPLYVYYAPRPDALSERPAPKLLPQILTPATLPALF